MFDLLCSRRVAVAVALGSAQQRHETIGAITMSAPGNHAKRFLCHVVSFMSTWKHCTQGDLMHLDVALRLRTVILSSTCPQMDCLINLIACSGLVLQWETCTRKASNCTRGEQHFVKGVLSCKVSQSNAP